uniref:Uncharacterized protein n=1 Tax=Vespula pensylvanica TaxID=30213 RepID=A0A834NKA9_VESPE|nr:hypothetical protein H0235_013551 [Vespula pensylvanica]
MYCARSATAATFLLACDEEEEDEEEENEKKKKKKKEKEKEERGGEGGENNSLDSLREACFIVRGWDLQDARGVEVATHADLYAVSFVHQLDADDGSSIKN